MFVDVYVKGTENICIAEEEFQRGGEKYEIFKMFEVFSFMWLFSFNDLTGGKS